MPVQKRMRLVKDGQRINAIKELRATHELCRKILLALAAANETITDLKLELMKYRGF